MTDKHSQHGTHTLQESELALEEPSFYNVILHNDDYTPMDFVIDILMRLFEKSYNDAYTITLEVHHNERGIAGIYSREIASERANKVNSLAKLNEFPLHCSIERV